MVGRSPANGAPEATRRSADHDLIPLELRLYRFLGIEGWPPFVLILVVRLVLGELLMVPAAFLVWVILTNTPRNPGGPLSIWFFGVFALAGLAHGLTYALIARRAIVSKRIRGEDKEMRQLF
jgi:hypothetical protein